MKTHNPTKRRASRGLIPAILAMGLIAQAATAQTNPEGLPEDILDALPAKKATLKLVAPGVEPPVIVVGKEASEPERYAADELSRHLEQITSQKIPIATDDSIPQGRKIIAIGKSSLTKDYDIAGLGIEQYIIDIKPDRVVIAGGGQPPVVDAEGVAHARERGTLYGVYEFLENLGVRWYRPEPWGWHIPKSETIELTLGRKTSAPPAFIGRSSVRMDPRWNGFKPEDIELTSDWAARQRLTVRSSDEVKYGGVTLLGINHAHSRIVSPAKYLKSHPEYFALVNGERGNPGSGRLPQLCLGNPELQRVFAENVIKQAKDSPNAFSISVDPEDGTHPDRRMCTCELCKAMDDPKHPEQMANRVFAFTNIIAKKVAEAVPEANLGLYAYSMHTEPPTLVEKLEPNIVVGAANINAWTDWSKKMFDPESAQNAQFVKLIKDWQKISTHPIWVRDYESYAWMGPVPMYHLLQDRVKAYRDLKVEGMLWPGTPNWGSQLLLIYLKAQLQWNPDLDLKKELDLFYTNYYGPAAVPMKAYHERWMQALEGSKLGEGLDGGIASGGRGMHMLCTPALLKELDGYIAQAQELVKGQSVYEKRLQGDVASAEYCRRIGDILAAKMAQGVTKPNPRYPSATYLDSETARVKWKDFTKWLLEANRENLTFEVMEKNGAPSATALAYMVRDVVENGRFATTDEKPMLQKNGF